MKPYPVRSNSESTKTTGNLETSSPAPGMSASAWEKDSAAKRSDTPQPPPVWTRYIDSRLRQFCTR